MSAGAKWMEVPGYAFIWRFTCGILTRIRAVIICGRNPVALIRKIKESDKSAIIRLEGPESWKVTVARSALGRGCRPRWYRTNVPYWYCHLQMYGGSDKCLADSHNKRNSYSLCEPSELQITHISRSDTHFRKYPRTAGTMEAARRSYIRYSTLYRIGCRSRSALPYDRLLGNYDSIRFKLNQSNSN
jgi:hypothetical protein